MAKERKDLLLTIGNEKVVIELLWDEAPNLCQKIWDNLPVESTSTLAKLCNHEIIIMLPFGADRENLQDVTVGAVGWWDVRSAINIWFDDMGPNGPLGKTALFGRVKENLEGCAREALKVWAQPGVKVKLERYEG